MKNSSPQSRDAFSLIEMLLIVGVVAVLAALLYPRLVNAKRTAQRIRCNGNLKQVGIGARGWLLDHTNLYPMQVSVQYGGTRELVAYGETFRHFEVMSNDLVTPAILVCPADKARTQVRFFTPALCNSNVSYFVGLDADEAHPVSFLAGDRNILGGTLIGKNILELTSTNGVTWGRDLHNGQGNVCLADCSVTGFSSENLRKGLLNTELSTNRLAMP